MRAAVFWFLLFVVSTINVAHAQGGAIPVSPYQNHPDMPEFWTPEYRAERNREMGLTEKSERLINPRRTFTGGAFHADWCLMKDGNRDIREKSMNNGNCASYVIGYGAKSEHELARDAINAIVCEGNVKRAVEYLQVCQCHNRSSQRAVGTDFSGVKAWAQERANEIGLSCQQATPTTPPTPQPRVTQTPTPVFTTLVVECMNPSSSFGNPSTGRGEVQGIGPNCEAARQDALAKAGDRNEFCRRVMQHQSYISTTYRWLRTGTCG